jgi:hypothetical protein
MRKLKLLIVLMMACSVTAPAVAHPHDDCAQHQRRRIEQRYEYGGYGRAPYEICMRVVHKYQTQQICLRANTEEELEDMAEGNDLDYVFDAYEEIFDEYNLDDFDDDYYYD